MQFVAGVVVSLIICIALLMSSGVSKAMGAPLPAEPKSLKVSETEFLIVSEPKSMKISELKSLRVLKPKSLESGVFLKGKYTPAERENVEYLRCGKLEGFSDRQQCALEALGITQEDVN